MERGGYIPQYEEGSDEHGRKIQNMLATPEGSEALYTADKILWIRGAISIDTGRRVSAITDDELYMRYMEYGKIEWDPHVAQAVRQYLRSKGY